MKGTVANPVRTLRGRLRQLSVQLPYSSLPGAFQVRPATLLAHCYPYNPGSELGHESRAALRLSTRRRGCRSIAIGSDGDGDSNRSS